MEQEGSTWFWVATWGICNWRSQENFDHLDTWKPMLTAAGGGARDNKKQVDPKCSRKGKNASLSCQNKGNRRRREEVQKC